ncbi:MAG: PTS sugar transporter subunit IIB [Erysipelotrichaceae bacterium]|jgi:PTS system mannose-specific IIB component|nr:PTS sugar transporter subunit IIB [Erysipelotrichaceae bacterium]
MANICDVRIDERLIHGQVATLWQGTWKCQRIMVIDEASAKDDLMKSVLRMSCPSTVKLSVLEPVKAAENLASGRYGDERITIVTKHPGNLVTLHEHGFDVKKVTVGNMTNGEGKRQITKSVFVTPADIENFKLLESLGVEMKAQMVPSEVAVDFIPLLK